MDGVNEILDGSDYFFCERAKCKLRIAICLQRQELNKTISGFEIIPFPMCENCSQGEMNRLSGEKEGMLIEQEAKKDDSQTITPDVPSDLPVDSKESRPENTRQCACGKITISPGSPLCPSCMAVRANEIRKAKKKESEKKAKRSRDKDIEKKTSRGPKATHRDKLESTKSPSDTAVPVEFKRYDDLFNWLKREADDQVRTLSGQIIWILKNFRSSQPDNGG